MRFRLRSAYHHPIVKIIYRSRMVCYFYILLAMIIIFFQQIDTTKFIFLVIIPCLLWPHLAYLISSNRKKSQFAEYSFMSVDSFTFGCYAAWTHFNPWFTLALLMFITIGNTSIGGYTLFFLCLTNLSLGIGISGYANDYQINLISSFWLASLSILFILFYMSYIGYLIYLRSTKINETKKKLLQANSEITLITQMVHAANCSVNVGEMIQSVLPLLKTIFSFDALIFQFTKKENAPYRVHTIYSDKLTDIEKQKIKILAKKSSFKGYIDHCLQKEIFSSSADQKLFEFKPFSAILSLPIILDKNEVGLLVFYNYTNPFTLSEKDINLVKKACTQIGLVIKNSLLYQKMIEHKAILNKKKDELEMVSSKLSHYLSPQVFEHVFSGKKEVKIESTRKRLTIFFSEISGFSNLTEIMKIELLTSILNNYLNEMSSIVLKHGGTIDKYIGDTILVFFGDPESRGVKQDALECVLMALEMQKALLKLYEKWRKLGIPETIKVKMGINSGFCTVGNFGSEFRIDYTIIGGQVNVASRLQSYAKPGTILISENTYLLVKNVIDCEKSDKIHVKGIAHEIQTYHVKQRINDGL